MKHAWLVSFTLALLAPGAHAIAQTAPAAPAAQKPAAAPASPRPAARPAARPTRDSLTVIRERGRLIACVAPQGPWTMHATDGSLKGFSIDLAKELADDLGVGIEFVVEDFSSLIPALAEGECDVIAGGLSPTPDRALFAHFSDPVARHDIGVLTIKAGSAGWTKAEDLNRPEITVAAVSGSAELLDARRVFSKAKILEVADANALGTALVSGEAQAGVVTEPLPALAVKLASDKLATPLAEPIGNRGEALAVRRGDLEFLAYLNTWVDAHRYDGWLKERRQYWFVDLAWANGQ